MCLSILRRSTIFCCSASYPKVWPKIPLILVALCSIDLVLVPIVLVFFEVWTDNLKLIEQRWRVL